MVTYKPLFAKVSLLSAISVFILFALGGLVRISESGMGCPDWPRCFGKWIPPISESELPKNYQEIFLEKRLQKVDKLKYLLNILGLKSEIGKFEKQNKLNQSHRYSFKTAYIEYINRIFGVITGFLALLTAYFGFKTTGKALVLGFLGLLFILINGYLGSIVVDTNLIPGIVTLHFCLALIPLLIYIYAYKLYSKQILISTHLKNQYLILFFILTSVLILGVSTRSSIDWLKSDSNFILSQSTVFEPGFVFLLHRVISILSFILVVFYYFKNKNKLIKQEIKIINIIFVLFVLQMTTGFINVIYNIPSITNLFHIIISILMYSLVFYMTIVPKNAIKK